MKDAPINLLHIINHVGSDPKIHQHLVSTFLVQANDILQFLRSSKDKLASKRVKQEIESFKTAAQIIGAVKIEQSCGLLEEGIKQNKPDQIRSIIDVINQECKQIQRYITNELNFDENKNQSLEAQI